MRRTILALLLCLTAAVLYADPPTAIAIRGARVVTVSGPVLARGTVLLRDGLIEAVGEDLALPNDAWIIDGTGLTVYPGLIDSLSGTGIPEPAPAVITTPAPAATPGGGRRGGAAPVEPVVRGPNERPSNNSWIRAADLIDPADRRIEEARSAGFTSAIVFPSGSIFSGQGAVVNLAGTRKQRMVVASPAGQYITVARAGIFGEFPASLMGAIAYVRQVVIDANNYKLEKAAWERHAARARRPEYDRALEGVNESPRLLLPASNAVELDRMLRFAAELKTPAVLYGGHEAFRVAPEVARAGTPLLVSLKWPERQRDSDPDEPVQMRTLELWDQAPSTPAALAKAGARFAFYSDGTLPRDIPKAVKKAITAGLPAAEAVRALTLDAARIYGIADRLGSIEKGKLANLVVTDGDLFEERTKVKYVIIDGVKYAPLPAAETPALARGGDQ